ncbi:MAG: hypothetical protein V9G12_03865 [Microthrixaceae bacterium]
MSGDPDAIPSDVAGAAARVADAADDRRRLREARNRNAGRTSMRDVLVGAAERSSTVTLVLGHGRSHRVQVVAVGADAVVAAPVGGGHDADRRLLVGLAAVRTIVVHRARCDRGGCGLGRPGSAGRRRPAGRDGGSGIPHERHLVAPAGGSASNYRLARTRPDVGHADLGRPRRCDDRNGGIG